jgi:hypothetical protein
VQGLGDSHAASGHEQDGDIHGEFYKKGGICFLHPFADGLEQLIYLLGREDERDDNLFFEWGDVEEGILLKDPLTNEETKEAPGD